MSRSGRGRFRFRRRDPVQRPAVSARSARLRLELRRRAAEARSRRLTPRTSRGFGRSPRRASRPRRFSATLSRDAARSFRPTKGLIGFVGGPWTLFVYAVEGHARRRARAREVVAADCTARSPIDGAAARARTSRAQFDGGADVVMVFDTAAGELSPAAFRTRHRAGPSAIADAFPGTPRLLREGPAAGAPRRRPALARRRGRASASTGAGIWLARSRRPAAAASCRAISIRRCLHLTGAALDARARRVSRPRRRAARPGERRGWICGLGHGVLPQHARSERAHASCAPSGDDSHDALRSVREVRRRRCRGTRAIRPCRSGTPSPTTDEWTRVARRGRSPRPDATLSLYVHLPFCESLCTFCGCNTVITRDHGREHPYVDLVLARARSSTLRACRAARVTTGAASAPRRRHADVSLAGRARPRCSTAFYARLSRRAQRFEGSVEADPRVTTRGASRDDCARAGSRASRSACRTSTPEVAAARQSHAAARDSTARLCRATRARPATSRSTSI